MNKYDIIIIGAGLGGLTAGAKLSKEGRKVLIIEQHDRPGGCATTFWRKDYTMEVGLHEMDGLDGKDMKTRIFRDLGVFDQVTFLKVPEFYRFVNDRCDFIMPHDPEVAKKRLTEEFPGEKKGIEAYFYQLLNARQIIKESGGKDTSLGAFLDSIIHNEDLKLILLGNLGYFNDDPYTLSLMYYSVAQGSYFSGGGNYIKEGSQKLSDYLADFIRQNGGEILLDHLVTGIIVKEGKAAGVHYIKNTGTKNAAKNHLKSNVETAVADIIIANASVPAVANQLLPLPESILLKKAIGHKKIGASLLTVYCGFKTSLKQAGNQYYSIFLFDPSVIKQADIVKSNRGPFEQRSFTFVDYSQVDSGLAPEGKSVGAVCCVDYTSDWEYLSREEYKARKEKVARIFIEKLDRLIPGFRNAIDYYEVGTSKTVERYTMNPQGAVYGFAQLPGGNACDNFRVMDNLFFASAWDKYGGGFSGVIYSGYMCALEILRRK
jgi:phytoene dehydrogenase-like protein